ncbi:MAG: TetR/AcrR family transcriptional regulator [Pseudomonadota bacterium]
MTLEKFRADRAAHKRAAVLAAAEESFRKEGFMRASMETVARKAEVSTATLYRYFPSKEVLFDAVAGATMDQLELDVDGQLESEDSLRHLARAYARLLSEPRVRSIFRMVVAECGRDAALAERFYLAVKSRLSDLFVQAITIARDRGELSVIPQADHVAGQLQGMIEHSTLMRGLVLGDDVNTKSEANQIADDALQTWLSRWAVKAD